MTDATADLMAIHHREWDKLLGPGSMFEMGEADVRGRTLRVFTHAPGCMRDVWALTADKGDLRYIVYEDEHYTYAEAHRIVRTLAQQLIEEFGVEPGDRVAIGMRNYPEWVFAYWAVTSTGAAVVGMNAWWTTDEMEYALDDSKPKVLICDDERLGRVMPIYERLADAARLRLVSVRSDAELPESGRRWDDLVTGDDPGELPKVVIDPDDDACIFYTSGTTGFPKGAQLTHRGNVHNLMHMGFMQEWGKQVTLAVVSPPQSEPIQPCIMAPTPLFHVTANNCLLHPATAVGGAIVLTYRWDPGRALELIERERVTSLSGVPTMSRELLAHPDFERRDTSSMKSLGGGGAPIPPDLVGKIGEKLLGGVPSTGYGLTETHGIVTANIGATYLTRPDSCGPVVPTCDAVVRNDLGEDLPQGSTGLLWVRGPIIIKGYLNKPDATAEVIQDGWFNTGDIGFVDDDGFVHIVDRAKDMVLRGGENVYCAEVEGAAYKLDGVAEVAVFAVPDERLGEEVGMAIVPEADADITEERVREFVARHLASFKVPRYVWILDKPLPRNANGKFVKRTLRDELVGDRVE